MGKTVIIFLPYNLNVFWVLKRTVSIIGLARLFEISVNRSIYKRKKIIDVKIPKLVTFNGCSIYLLNLNPSVIASCYFLFRPEVHSHKQ